MIEIQILFCYAGRMSTIFYFQFFFGSIVFLGMTYPAWTLTIIHQLKQRIRHFIVQRDGQRAWLEIAKNFREKTTKAGYSTELVDEILEEYRQTMIEKVGNQKADEILRN